MEGWDTSTKAVVQKIPLLTVKAGPRDGEEWKKRLKEEYQVRALILWPSNHWSPLSNHHH
jgi:ufm1-conjugating enzyme 1